MPRHAARTDGLTQLPNRAAVFEQVQLLVNGSAVQLRTPSWIDEVQRCLTESQLAPERLQLALTDSQAALMRRLHRDRGQGCWWAKPLEAGALSLWLTQRAAPLAAAD